MKFLDLYFFPNKQTLTPDEWALWMKVFPRGAIVLDKEQDAINELRRKVGNHQRMSLCADEDRLAHKSTDIYNQLCAFIPPAGAVLTNAISHGFTQVIADYPAIERDYFPRERYLPRVLCQRLGWYCYLSLWSMSRVINF